MAAVSFAAGCATAGEPKLSKDSLVGAWECGPTTMHGPDFDVVATTHTIYGGDSAFTEITTTVITPRDKYPMTTEYEVHGTWRLDADVITTNVTYGRFLSSTDPSVGVEHGQQALDEQLKKKSTTQTRVLAFAGTTFRSIPVNAMYKEAVVESPCKRQ